MSRQDALDNIALKPCGRWGHTQYSLGSQREYWERKLGLSMDNPQYWPAVLDAVLLDFRWSTNDGLIDWSRAGRTTDMGHAAYAADASDQRAARVSPFQTLEEVWAFDAVAEYGLPDRQAQIDAYEKSLARAVEWGPGQIAPGGTYKTLVSGAIESFGWDMLLMGASDPVRMEPVWDSFFRRSKFLYECWAATSAEVILTHDDFVWTEGPFIHPDIYRKVLIPRYAELFKITHAAGKKHLFCSDGDYSMFVDDLAEAGADGFIFEPVVDFDMMTAKFGASHCLVGSCVDCRDLTFGRRDKVLADIRKTFECLKRCRGAIVAVGNHLPANIPGEMLDFYFGELLPRLDRSHTEESVGAAKRMG